MSLARLRMECLEDRLAPATFTVNTTLDDVTPANGRLSLREAIAKANTTPGADIIVLPAGVFKITQTGAGEDANATGDFDITDAVTIQGVGAGRSLVDGQQLDRVFDVRGTAPSSIKVVFAGLTVRNGNAADHGGGIRVGNADLVVRDSVVSDNRAASNGGGISNSSAQGTGNIKVVRSTLARNGAGVQGGGLFVFGISDLTMIDSRVRRNLAAQSGGGIYSAATTLTNCVFSDNSAVNGGGGLMVGIATLTNCTVSGNSAVNGGGGGISANTATLTNCTVSSNFTNGNGGGIATFAGTLTNCTINGNFGANGGGIVTFTMTLTNCTISGNSATSGGGLLATEATLRNCTVVENSAHTGGGLFHEPGGSFSLANTLVALNLNDLTGTGPDLSGDFISLGHNLIGNDTGGTGFTNGTSGDMVGTIVNPIDPKLGSLVNNGGKTKTHALLAGSPAIDAGDNVGVPGTDQRGAGFLRKKDGNGDGRAIVDIGAFER